MTFQIGDKVVYPNQGIGTVENISSRPIGAVQEKCYLLRFGCNSMTVLVPFSNAGAVGLRGVTTDCDISRILSFLAGGPYEVNADWKARFKENTDKMQSGDPMQVAEVLKSLVRVHSARPLSFREKKMLDRARNMLAAEISISRGISEAHAQTVLDHALSQDGLRLPAAG